MFVFLEPTTEPTHVPSYEPTYLPSYQPTFEPTFEPTHGKQNVFKNMLHKPLLRNRITLTTFVGNLRVIISYLRHHFSFRRVCFQIENGVLFFCCKSILVFEYLSGAQFSKIATKGNSFAFCLFQKMLWHYISDCIRQTNSIYFVFYESQVSSPHIFLRSSQAMVIYK